MFVGLQYICFKKGKAFLIKIIRIATLLNKITFYVLLANILFLYCLSNIDKIGI